MNLIQEAEALADEIAKHEPNTKIESIIRRLLVELKIRKNLELKLQSDPENPEMIRVKRKAHEK